MEAAAVGGPLSSYVMTMSGLPLDVRLFYWICILDWEVAKKILGKPHHIVAKTTS